VQVRVLPLPKRSKDAACRNVTSDFEREVAPSHLAQQLCEQLSRVPTITDFIQFSVFIGEFIDACTLLDLRFNSMEISGNSKSNDTRTIIYNHVRGGVSIICLPGELPHVMNRRVTTDVTLPETFFYSAVKIPLHVFQHPPEGPVGTVFSSLILSEPDFCADCGELNRKCFVFPDAESKCRYCFDPTESRHSSRWCPFFSTRLWKHSMISAETCCVCVAKEVKYHTLTWREDRRSILLLAEHIIEHYDAANFLHSLAHHKNKDNYPNFYETCPANWFPTVLHDKSAAFQILLCPGHLPLIGYNYKPAHCFCQLALNGLFEGATLEELHKAIRIVRKFNNDYQINLIKGSPIPREYDSQRHFRGIRMKASDFLCFRQEWAHHVENDILYDLDFEKYKLQQMRHFKEDVPLFFAETLSYNSYFQGPRPTPTACHLKYRDTSESSAEDSDFTMDHSHVYMQDVTVTPTSSRSSSGVSFLTSDDEQGEATITGMPHA